MDKFLNKYRIPSARAAFWDYSSNGLYFITVCTAGRKCLFGEIAGTPPEMMLSAEGRIMQVEWDKSFGMRAELFCDAFVIMPNHIHTILRIDAPGQALDSHQPLPAAKNHGIAYRPAKSISSFMGGYKSAVTKGINQYRNTVSIPVWQTRFHDHIIRNEAEYIRIATYIENNISNWRNDKFFPR